MNYSNSNNIELSFYFKPYIDNINLQLILKDTTTNNEHIISLNTNDFVLNEWNYINKIFIHELLSDISEKPYNNIQLTFSIQATNISNIDSSILVASIDDISMSGSLQKPMQYVSSRVFQKNNTAEKNEPNVNILGLEIVTEHSGSPIKISEINFSTKGTTDIENILNIKIFSTGRDSIFNTHNLLATTFVSENFSFEDIELQEGKNYFWLTYDINYYVQTLNLMDAKCDNIQIYNHTIVPENNDPEEAVVIVDRYPYFYIPPQPYSDSVIYVNDGAERNMDGDYIVRVEVSQNNINSIKIKAFWYPSSDDIYTYYYGINLNINIYENNNWETIDSNFKNRTSPITSPNLDRINELFKDYSFQEPLTDTVYIRLSLIDLISNTDRMTGFYGCADCGTGNVDDRDFDNVEIRIFPPILNQFSFSVVDYYICENDSISIAGKYQSENGLYLDSTTSVFGGDSIVFYRLYSLPSVHSITEYSICMGDSILIDNIWYNQNISITDTLISVSGCDSISGIIVNVLAPEERTQEVSICEGEYFNTYSEQGTYYDTIQSSMGCDSIITTYLNIVPLFSEKNTIISICQGDSILGYSTSGIYRDTIIDDFCPYTQVLHLEVNPKYFLDTSIYICENISIPGSGIYTESFKTNKGCDSIIRTTLVTNFKHFVSESIIINESENYRGYTSTGTYVDTLVSSYGCDSIVILLLTVNESEDTQEHTLTDNSILIYPSIVNDYISVELIGTLPSNFNILIYNELGVLVYFNNHIINKNNKIDVSKYNSGIYLIEISNNNKRIIYRKKFVKR